MSYGIGKTYELHGQRRRVIGFDGAMRPITELLSEPETKSKEELFTCEACGKACANAAGLAAHKRAAHGT